jgi:hypothetical protein
MVPVFIMKNVIYLIVKVFPAVAGVNADGDSVVRESDSVPASCIPHTNYIRRYTVY